MLPYGGGLRRSAMRLRGVVIDTTWACPRGDGCKGLILLNARCRKVLLTLFLLTLRTV
jgi:hypothetical protein